MKLSDYVAQFLSSKVDTVFCVTGGCIINVIDSIARSGLPYLPMQHEQSCAFAADAYARIRGFGVALATSGPGATNLLTGVCVSYYDSIPVMYITGQVPRTHLKRETGTRQIGFQETYVVGIFRPVTKYAVQVSDSSTIRYELEKAFYLANDGRKGPVLLDICDDVQRAEIDPESLVSFIPPKKPPRPVDLAPMMRLLENAERPLFIFGAGTRKAKLAELVSEYGIPFTLTWGASDFLSHDDPLFAGGFGVSSSRSGNFAIQNADLLICMGTRLDSHETGSNYKGFAPKAQKIIIDIDPTEQAKYKKRGLKATLITAEAERIVEAMLTYRIRPASDAWRSAIVNWRLKYPAVTQEDREQDVCVNPYVFMERLSKASDRNAIVIADAGSSNGWMMQAFNPKEHRLIHAWNHSPMGYALPAAIGAAMASGKQIICIAGDGAFNMNVQELATVARHKIDIKMFVMNNHCYGMIEGTQDAWLGGRHHAASIEGGLPDVDFINVAKAYGIPALDADLTNLEDILKTPGPVLANVDMKSQVQIAPKLLYGNSLEDLSPRLPPEELAENMKC
ncbi:MAG: thiamine pyrophosphate-binding protein [Parcubacteria group bacterium]